MTAHPLRSRNWFGRNDLDGFVHRSWLKTEGFSDLVFDGRPVIGIANSWSELTNCNAHLRQVADAVKRGAWSAGGYPLEFPTISLGEILMKPTTMLFRNLMAMDVEECLRAYPLDAVVLLSGCDKTTPAMLMGTASTMASMAEALGLTLPGNAAIPAPDSRRLALAELSGRRAVEMALAGGPKPSEILTAQAFDNAIRADMAIGGSTNAIIHLVAIAGRVGVPLPLARFDELARTTPFLANLRPSGKYLMEDFFYAGGLPAVLKELLPLLHGDAPTVNGKSMADNVRDARCWNEDVIRPLGMPLAPEGGTVILSGNLCPDGAVLKQSAASPHLLTHRGRAVVFEDHDDLHRRIDAPDLPVDERSVLVLKRVGPKGAPGMPEWGAAPIPEKLLRAGVKDMVRISDARMSGTSYGAAHAPRRDRLTTPAATASSSSTTSCKRTRAWTSTSCVARPRCARTTRRGRVIVDLVEQRQRRASTSRSEPPAAARRRRAWDAVRPSRAMTIARLALPRA